MTTYLILYIISLFTFLCIDFVWLRFLSGDLYKNSIGHLLADKVKFKAALVFYLIFVFGIVFFSVIPAIDKESIAAAVVNGAMFGFMTYSTYYLTNFSTLKNWPLKLVLIDISWGALLSSSISLITYLLYVNVFSW